MIINPDQSGPSSGFVHKNKETELLMAACSVLAIEPESLGSFAAYYDAEFASYGNEVYGDIRSRLVHLLYFLNGSWWNGRFEYLFRDWPQYMQIVDLGFSAPYLPLHIWQEGPADPSRRLPRMIYVDLNDTSQRMSKILLSEMEKAPGADRHVVDYAVGSLEEADTWKKISEYAGQSGKRLFCAFETIEHLEHPEAFWQHISQYAGEDMIISLPIGPAIPSHHLVFEDAEAALSYVREHIDISEFKVIVPPPDVKSDFSLFVCKGKISV